MFKPVWMYGIQLWGCAKLSHMHIIQRLQSKVLRSITKGLWYVSNCTLHNDLHIPLVATEINRLSLPYHKRLVGHHNPITATATPPTIVRRLKRQWPTDLFHTAAGDKPCALYHPAKSSDGVPLLNDFSVHVTHF